MEILVETKKDKLSKIQNDWNQEHKTLKLKLSEFEKEFKTKFSQFEKNWKNWNTHDVIEWIKCLKNPKSVLTLKSKILSPLNIVLQFCY